VVLRAQVAPETVGLCGNGERDALLDNNWTEDLTVRFQQRNGLRIGYLPIRSNASCWTGPELPSGAVRDAAAWTYRVLPLANPPEYTRYPSPDLEFDRCIDSRSGESASSLIRALNARMAGAYLGWLLAGLPPDRRPPDQLVGWLPDGAYSSNGKSSPIFNDGTGVSLFANDTPGQREWTMAHEIGHNLGLVHAGSSLAGLRWPYEGEEIQETGLDIVDLELKPTDLIDFMLGDGAEATRWISPYYWRVLFEGNLRPWDFSDGPPGGTVAGGGIRVGRPTSAQQAPAASAIVSGVVEVDGTAELAPVLGAPVTNDGRWAPRGGSHCLQLVSADGSRLADHCFEPEFEPEHGPPGAAAFTFILPWPEGVASVVLATDGARLAEWRAGQGTPLVTLTEPGISTPLSGAYAIQWQASDPDGDALTYVVHYRASEGDTWQLVATELTTPELHWDTAMHPGGAAARLRVTASDGLNSGYDESDVSFPVAREAPTVAILQPKDGTNTPRLSSVLLLGQAHDLEDGELAAASLGWTSDRDGALGSGRHLATDFLSPGRHEITLSAVDSDGMVVRDTIALWVGDRIWLPAAHASAD
jgi:hypothetical protein